MQWLLEVLKAVPQEADTFGHLSQLVEGPNDAKNTEKNTAVVHSIKGETFFFFFNVLSLKLVKMKKMNIKIERKMDMMTNMMITTMMIM